MKKNESTDTPVKKNDIVEIEIDGMGYEGEGIAHVGGYTVFIRYALPGERVRALIILAKPTFAVGKLQAVLAPSADRAEPFCPAYYRCGGCAYQHVSYAAQLRYKRDAVIDAFKKTAHLTVVPDATVPSPQTRNYRNKMSLPVRGEPAETGFFASGTHRVVPIGACPIQFNGNGELIAAFTEFLHRNKISGYNETTHGGEVRHLAARKLGDFITVTVVTNGDFTQKLLPFDAELRKLYGDDYAYYINENTTQGNRILGQKSERVGGSAPYATVDGLRVSVHPHSFFQVNDGVRELLYAEVCNEVTSDTVIDAYSGAGVLSALLARRAKSVTAIEIEPTATESAQRLLRENGIGNVRTICGDCAEKLPPVIAAAGECTLVLDPPRAGCDRRVLAAAAGASPQKIVYVSCNPATLARDAAYLTQSGYTLARVTPFDMFAHCAGVETLCVFMRIES